MIVWVFFVDASSMVVGGCCFDGCVCFVGSAGGFVGDWWLYYW